MTAKMPILGDVIGPQQRGNPQYVRCLVEHITSFLLKVKSFGKDCVYGVHFTYKASHFILCLD